MKHPSHTGYRTLLCLLFILAGPLVRAAEPDPAHSRAEKAHRTDWLHRAKWGVMFHYCSNWKGLNDGERWNQTIQEFDVAKLASQLHEAKAGYFVITAKHCGNPIAPNAAYERIHPGKCPKRDLIADLAGELAKKDIPLMLYYATGMGIDADFSARVIEEYSKRHGPKVKGWWLDNNIGKQDLQKQLAAAARSGNPDALVAFSPPKGFHRNSPFDDYTAGNEHAPRSARCAGRFVDGVQWHMLSYLGHNWGGVTKYKDKPRFNAETAARITKNIADHGGVVTWDVPHQPSGSIGNEIMDQLRAIGTAVANDKGE